MSKYNYYTPIELAALLLELIPQKASISSAIDICCGSWNLLAAAKRHYPEVKITGVDIDPAAHAHCIEGATKFDNHLAYSTGVIFDHWWVCSKKSKNTLLLSTYSFLSIFSAIMKPSLSGLFF